MAEQAYWFGRRPLRRKTVVAWGARAIFNGRTFHLLPDRQSSSGANPETRIRLRRWIDETGLPWLRTEVNNTSLCTMASTILAHDDAGFHIEASPQQSGGYLYIGAWYVGAQGRS